MADNVSRTHATDPLTWQIHGKYFDLSAPRIMGILNVTPDSFSDGGRFNSLESALGQIGLMAGQGADIIDIGGESTRPGSDPVTEEEELDRVIPVLEKALSEFPDLFFSIDTTKYAVAQEALKRGVHFVNDVSGLQKEPGLAELTGKHGAAYILMHAQGDPKTMQENPVYRDVIADISVFFERQTERLRENGVEHIVIDPGIGFGKTLEHNLSIIRELEKFSESGYPLLIGASRKSMIGQILNDCPVDKRLAGTIALHYHALLKGAKILRVHDVKEAKDSVLVYNAIMES